MRDTDGNEWGGCDPRWEAAWNEAKAKPPRTRDKHDDLKDLVRLNRNVRLRPRHQQVKSTEEFAVKIQKRF